jgi:hypothetical protein
MQNLSGKCDWCFVCLMVFNATFNNISVCRCGQFYWWRKQEYSEKTTDLSQVTDKLYHIVLYTSPWSRFKLITSMVTAYVVVNPISIRSRHDSLLNAIYETINIEWLVSDCCLRPWEQVFCITMRRTSYIWMTWWWWYLHCNRPTPLFGFLLY